METVKNNRTFFHFLSGQTAPVVLLRSLLVAFAVSALGLAVAVALASVVESGVDCDDFVSFLDSLLEPWYGSLFVSGAAGVVIVDFAACVRNDKHFESDIGEV